MRMLYAEIFLYTVCKRHGLIYIIYGLRCLEDYVSSTSLMLCLRETKYRISNVNIKNNSEGLEHYYCE